MNKQNLDKIEKAVESKYGKIDKKKRTKMKVSGGSVKKLQKIIKDN